MPIVGEIGLSLHSRAIQAGQGSPDPMKHRQLLPSEWEIERAQHRHVRQLIRRPSAHANSAASGNLRVEHYEVRIKSIGLTAKVTPICTMSML